MNFLFLFLTVVTPTLGFRLVCFWNGSSSKRTGIGRATVHDMKPMLSLCTHLIYGYATINDDNYRLEAKGSQQWREVMDLKRSYPQLSILLSVGGFEDPDFKYKYLRLLEKAVKRSNFVESVKSILREYNFDGIDLAWQFPTPHDQLMKKHKGFWDNVKSAFGKDLQSKAVLHRNKFVTLCSELKSQLNQNNKLVSISHLPHVNALTYIDTKALVPFVDMVNLWAVDFCTPEICLKADYPHPLYYRYSSKRSGSVPDTINHWKSNGFPTTKINLGIATWGRAWKINAGSIIPPVPAVGTGAMGPFTKILGLYSYYEICSEVSRTINQPTYGPKSAGLVRIAEPTKALGVYAYRLPDPNVAGIGGLWIGYEEPDTAEMKAIYAKARGLGGVAILDLGLDDPQGTCGIKFPITSAVKNIL